MSPPVVRSLLVAMAVALAAAVPAARAAEPAPVRLAQLDQLMLRGIRKPRVTLVLGSFDWVHDGHRSLIGTAAPARGTHDLALVHPIAGWSRKPALEANFPRRVEQLRREVGLLKNEGVIDDRVMVSDAGRQLPKRPGDLLGWLREHYPNIRFSVAVPSEAFDKGSHWKPTIDQFARLGGIDLIVVDRPGLRANRRRIARLKKQIDIEVRKPWRPVRISSSEIKRALLVGDLSSIEDRVPRGTLSDLRAEFARLENERSAAQNLVGGRWPAEKSFAQLREECPEGALCMLEGVEEKDLQDEEVRRLLAGLQERINVETRALQRHLPQLDYDHRTTADRRFGFTEKFVARTRARFWLLNRLRHWLGRSVPREDLRRTRYLFKKADPVYAAKQQTLTVLANLLGIDTPLALSAAFREPRAKHTAVDGVALRWIDGLIPALTNEQAAAEKGIPLYDFSRASPRVLKDLLVGRFLDQALFVQDVWWADWNAPRLADGRHDPDQLVRFDFKMAWERREAESVREALNTHFGFDAPLEKLRWTDRKLDWSEPIGFQPEHWDSPFTMYGPLLHAYVLGQTTDTFDIAAVRKRIRTFKRIPRQVLENVLGHYTTKAAGPGNGWGLVPAQAEHTWRYPADFLKRAVDRIVDNIEPYCTLLDRFATAREDAREGIQNDIVDFYRRIEKMDL